MEQPPDNGWCNYLVALLGGAASIIGGIEGFGVEGGVIAALFGEIAPATCN